MDTAAYLPMFLAECRENLQQLNLAVVKVEETPDDREVIDEIFRVAHSLKGMSATMGFAAMAALTHKMEDVFELLRQRAGGLEREAIDVLLECLDALEAAVESIDTTGEERLDPETLVSRLNGLVRAPGPAEPAKAAVGRDEILAKANGRPVVRVAVQLTEDAQMPAVRAFMVLSALEERGELLGSVPDREALEGFDGQGMEAWVVGDAAADLQAVAAGVPDVESVLAEPVTATAVAEKAEPAKAARKTQSVRVDAERLDQLMHHMGELVVHRTHVEQLALQAGVPGLMHAMQDLTRASQALQQMVMQVRMIPVEAVFLRFPRLVRDLSSRLGKQVELDLVGKETELDRTVVDALGDPIVHLVRNALDHGLEPADERVAAGKPAAGRLEISARHAGGSVVITVRDDGRGIDPDRVAAKAAERGLVAAGEPVDMARAVELLFTPGFSTAEATSDISGRGVGMDAVRAAIRELGGEVVMESVLGQGTTAHIRLPLTLAIVSVLLVECEGTPYAVPLDRVERTVRLGDHAVRSVAGSQMLVMRDGVLPLLDARDELALGAAPGDPDPTFAVIVRGREQRLALGVERLVGQQELVTRPLPEDVAEHSALSGGAVLSNGDIALIVDCDALGALERSLA
jgi:two-component system chemotaxis sensor kinase CheA